LNARSTVEAKAGNLGLAAELTESLCMRPGLRIERIVSTGQATPEGEWCDQDDDEFVLLVAGAAPLLIAGEAEARELRPGDWLLLPAHCRRDLDRERSAHGLARDPLRRLAWYPPVRFSFCSPLGESTRRDVMPAQAGIQ
jgi:cupin 2 domain-containing protein